MSYSKKFAGAVAAAVITVSASTGHAQSMMMDMDNGFENPPMVPPMARPFIGNLDVQISTGITFENGVPASTSLSINAENIECDFIEPLVMEEIANSIAMYERWDEEVPPAEQYFNEQITKLFQDRVLDINENLTPERLEELGGEDVSFFLPSDFPENQHVSIHLECSDYQAPEPSFTPVEPN